VTPRSANFDTKPDKTTVVHDHILAWFAAHGRDLPWRRTRDPYRILVSEIMLQQIQVTRAIPFYKAFIAHFPTIDALAEAPLAEVIRVWGDLGRYRRIVYLHRTAREVVERYNGELPRDVGTLKTLPGVGPYTAGAVACFAYEQDVGFADTNVRRVLGRIFLGTQAAERATDREVAELASRVVPKGRGWEWNQALLDFGALHCTARRPKCEQCPVAQYCTAYPVSAAPAARPNGQTATERFAGSNRYYRGRILATLRERAGETDDGIPLSELGTQIKPDFVEAEAPWLYSVVAGLSKDGLTVISEEAPAYDALGGEALRVRLP
jgi:A/G-specific adenine glycosylase